MWKRSLPRLPSLLWCRQKVLSYCNSEYDLQIFVLYSGGSPRNLAVIERAGKEVQKRLTLFRKVIPKGHLLAGFTHR